MSGAEEMEAVTALAKRSLGPASLLILIGAWSLDELIRLCRNMGHVMAYADCELSILKMKKVSSFA